MATVTPFPQTETPPPCPEALFSLSGQVHVLGHPMQLTIRGQTPEQLRANLAAMRGLLDAPAMAPAQPPPVAPAAQIPAQPAAEGWCPIHQVAMHNQTNERGSWWSHRLADGTWCRGKARKGA